MELHRCHGAADEAAGPGRVVRGPRRSLTVDVHAHALVQEVDALVRDRPEKQAEPEAQRRAVGAASTDYNVTTMRPTVFPKLTSVEQRLQDMDALGIDVQVVSPTSLQHYYWADPDLARQVVALTNETIAERCGRHPDRLVALGNVALQHPKLAVEQLEHCTRTLGMKGVAISTAVNGRELDDASFEPFWAKAEELGCVIFLHAADISSLGERINRFYLQNILGRPVEATIALSHLIFGGVLDRRPGLKILAAHGGGYLPFYDGRSDHGHKVRPEAHTCRHPPSEYLRRIWFDSMVYSPESLAHLVAKAGVGQVMLGTDYPYDMGDYDIDGLIEAALPDEADRAAVLGANAVRLFGLEALAEKRLATR